MSDKAMRTSLWLAGLLNFVAAGLFLFPGSAAGQLLGLPADVSLLYRAFLAFFLALIGASYLWTAPRAVINRTIVTLGTLGKGSAVPLGVGLWLAGEFPAQALPVMFTDLVFALLWFVWLGRPIRLA